MSNNLELLSMTQRCVLQIISYNYIKAGMTKNPIKTKELVFIKKNMHEYLDKNDPDYELQFKQIKIYETIYILINKLLHDKHPLSPFELTKKDSEIRKIFDSAIALLNDIYINYASAFVEMTQDENINHILVYFYMIDIIHHQGSRLQSPQYKDLNDAFLNQQNIHIKNCLKFLSPKVHNDDSLSIFRTAITYVNFIEGDELLKGEEFKENYIKSHLNSLMAQNIDLNHPIYIMTSFLKLALSSFVLKLIEENIPSIKKRRELSIKCLQTFEVESTVQTCQELTHLSVYSTLLEQAKSQYDNFAIYHKQNTSHTDFCHTLSERHYKQFLEYQALPHIYTPENISALISSLNTLITKVETLKILDIEWPFTNIDEQDFWNSCFKLLAKSTLPKQQLAIKISVLAKPMLLGLIKFNCYNEAYQLTYLLLELQKRYETHERFSSNLKHYSRLYLLLKIISEHNYINALRSSSTENSLLIPTSSKSDLSYIFTSHILNALFYFCSSEIDKENITKFLLFINNIIALFRNDSDNKKTLTQLLAFQTAIELLSQENTTEHTVSPSNQKKLNMNLLSELMNYHFYPSIETLKKSIVKKLSKKADAFFSSNANMSFSAHNTLVEFLNSFMPLLDVMSISSEEKDDLNSKYKFDLLETKRTNIILDLINSDNQPSPSKKKRKKKNKQLVEEKRKADEVEEERKKQAAKEEERDRERKAAEEDERKATAAESIRRAISEKEDETTWTTVKKTPPKKVSPNLAKGQATLSSPMARNHQSTLPSPKKQQVKNKATPSPVVAIAKTQVSPKEALRHEAVDLNCIGKKKSPSNPVSHMSFFKEAPYIKKDLIPDILLSLSHKFESHYGHPLILTGSAVRSLYTNTRKKKKNIHDYDCLAIHNNDMEALKLQIQQWAKSEGWSLKEPRIDCPDHPVLVLEFPIGDQEIKIDISTLKLESNQTLTDVLLLDAQERDLLHTTLHVPITNSVSDRLSIIDTLNALPIIESKTIEINPYLNKKSSQITGLDFFNTDPIRLLRVFKELIENDNYTEGDELKTYLPKITSQDYQQNIWHEFLNMHRFSGRHKNQLRTKLTTLSNRYGSEKVIEKLKRFHVLEAITVTGNNNILFDTLGYSCSRASTHTF